MLLMVFTAGCNKPDEPNNGGNNSGGNNGSGNNETIDTHEFVDLGLLSGTLWATCNVGADTPESYGDYFAWGEIASKTAFSWNTYKYSNGNYNQLTKYCNNSNYGYYEFTDNLTALQPDDDAATVSWGVAWHIPTKSEWLELFDNTNCSMTVQNGVHGMLFVAPNGNSIFIPAAGGWNEELSYVGKAGGYWSRDLIIRTPYEAWNAEFDSIYHGIGDYDRYLGFPIRPVRSAE